MPEFLYLFRNFVKHQIVSEKIFFREICGGCSPIFRVKKFWILKIALRKKKAPAKADAYFLSLK